MIRYDSYSVLRRANGDYYINVWDEDNFTLAAMGAFSSSFTADRRAQELGLTRRGGVLPEGIQMTRRPKRAILATVPTKTFDEAWADGISQFKR